jgi:hypothetical protein
MTTPAVKPSVNVRGWGAASIKLVVLILVSHAIAFFCHELAHSVTAWLLGAKADPLALNYGSRLGLGVLFMALMCAGNMFGHRTRRPCCSAPYRPSTLAFLAPARPWAADTARPASSSAPSPCWSCSRWARRTRSSSIDGDTVTERSSCARLSPWLVSDPCFRSPLPRW